MQDVLLQFYHRLPAMIMAVVMPVVVIVPVMVVVIMAVMMVMPMMVVIMTMGVLMMVVVVTFLRRQGYFRPLGIAAASANSAHNSSIIGRYRLRRFVQYESKGLHVQLFAGGNIFKITVAVWAGIEMMLQRKRPFTLQAYCLPVCALYNSISPFEGSAGYSRRPYEKQGLQLNARQSADLERDGLNARSARFPESFFCYINNTQGDRHFMHYSAALFGKQIHR